MSWWDSFTDDMSSVFTGRWLGGQNSVADQFSRGDFNALIPAAAVAAPFALGAAGIGPAAGLFGAEAAGGAAGESALGFATGEGGLASSEGIGAINTALGGGGQGGGISGITGGIGWLGDVQVPGSVAGAVGDTSPVSAFAPDWLTSPTTMFGGGGGGIAGDGGDLSGGIASAIGGGGSEGGAVAGTVGAAEGGFSPAAAESSLWSKGIDWVTGHPLQAAGLGISGALVGANLLGGQRNPPGVGALQGQAAQQAAQGQALFQEGQQLISYLQNGTLPPNVQAQVTAQVRAAKAKIVQGYASRGQSANPTQNTALLQELNNVDNQALELAGKLEQQLAQQGLALLQTGVTTTGMSSQLYRWLANYDRQQQKDLMDSISNFAASLGGGNRGVNINLGGTRAA